MIPARLPEPLQVKRGDTWFLRADVSDSEGTPIDLSGRSALMQLRPSATKPFVLELSTDNGYIVLDATGFSLEVPHAAMQAIPAALYVFDFQTTTGLGVVETLLTGTVQILEDITYED